MEKQGKAAFEDHYRRLWGERWTALRESLLMPALTIPYGEGLRKPYMMDRASILAAASLRIPAAKDPPAASDREETLILDACAAPGGKSLVIASRMGDHSRLLSNELSGERRRRLVNALDEHLDEDTRRAVTVSGFDAGELGGRRSEWGRFDAILLDAPCSSERHVIRSEKALAEWRPARPKALARRQWALLSAAFLLLKPGGSLVYATCALSPEENDGPVSRLLEKYSGEIEQDFPDFPEGEKTAHGKIILPDLAGGMGPMYVARFRKKDNPSTS